jgi:hypothetical protein
MASSGFEPTHIRGQDAFADLSVEATLIDPKYALPADLRQLADKLAEEESPALPPGAVTRVKVRVNQLGSGQSTQIGEMIPADMDVLMTAHLPTSFDLDDIAGDELGDARYEKKTSKPYKSIHNPLMSKVGGVFEPEVSDPIVRPVEDFSDADEPATVNAFLEHVLPDVARPPKAKPRKVAHNTTPMRPLKEPNLAADLIDTVDPDPTLPPMRLASPKSTRPDRSGFASPSSIPQNEVTKTCFGLEEQLLFDDDLPVDESLPLDEDVPFGDIAPEHDDGSFDDVPGFGQSVESARASFDQVLERVRKPRLDVAPQRYIPTKITSNPRIGITPEDTSIVMNDREETGDSTSGFADGKASIASREMSALTKPPRLVSPYIIVALGVVGAIAALVHAIQSPL